MISPWMDEFIDWVGCPKCSHVFWLLPLTLCSYALSCPLLVPLKFTSRFFLGFCKDSAKGVVIQPILLVSTPHKHGLGNLFTKELVVVTYTIFLFKKIYRKFAYIFAHSLLVPLWTILDNRMSWDFPCSFLRARCPCASQILAMKLEM